MQFDWEGLKIAIIRNPEGHEKLTGRYYLTEKGFKFVNAGQPKPVGAVQVPSLADAYMVTNQKLSLEELTELLAQRFAAELKGHQVLQEKSGD